MTEAVVLALAFSWVKGYRISEIAKLFKHWSMYPIILTCVIHIYFIISMIEENYWFLEYAKYIKILSLLLYFILILKYNLIDISVFKRINTRNNTHLQIWLTSPVVIGGLCTIIGSKLNQVAMFYNGNKMPIFVSNSWSTGYIKPNVFEKLLRYGDFHVFGSSNTKFIPLTDIFDMGYMVLSIGDVFVRLFVFLIIYYSIKAINNKDNSV